MTNVTENRNTLDTLRLLALSRNIPPEIVPVFKRLETGLPLVVSPAEWAAFSEWFDMCEAAGLAPELNQRLLEVRSRIFKAALAPACVVFMPAGVPRVKPAKLPALPAHPVKRKRASAALRYKAGYIAAPRVRIDYTDGSGFSAVRWIDGWMQRGRESQANKRKETCEDTLALAFDLGSSRRTLPQPTPTYEIKLALAFDMCSSCHPCPSLHQPAWRSCWHGTAASGKPRSRNARRLTPGCAPALQTRA